VATCQRGCSGN